MNQRMTIVLNPAAESTFGDQPLSRRPEALDGLTVGLLDNVKTNANVFLARIEERLREQYPGITVVRAVKRMAGEPIPPADFARLLACDVVVNAFGD